MKVRNPVPCLNYDGLQEEYCNDEYPKMRCPNMLNAEKVLEKEV